MSALLAKVLARQDVRAKFAPYAAIPLRLIVGYGFLAHAVAKWHKGPAAFAAILRAIGVPSPQLMAWLTISTEFLAGIAILIGAFVSLVSEGRARFGPPGYECNLLYIACVLALVLIGPSPWSVDNYRFRAPLSRVPGPKESGGMN